MKRILLFTILIGGAASWVMADDLMVWDFMGLVGNEPSVAASNVAAHLINANPTNLITRGPGITASNNANRFNANNWCQPTFSLAVTSGDYFEVMAAADPGYQFIVTGVFFRFEKSSTGPSNFVFCASDDDYGANLASWSFMVNGSYGANLARYITNSGPVLFRFFGYGNTASAGSAGFEGVDADLILQGYVIPEPLLLSGLGLFGALAFLVRRRG